jgi:hypothetical protein
MAGARQLLPGTRGPELTPPRGRWRGVDEVKLARRRADLRDLADVVVFLAVDVLYVAWPSTRIPFLTRDDTSLVLVAAHILLAAGLTASRMLPRWRAQRIASTWSERERRRFVSAETKRHGRETVPFSEAAGGRVF